MTNNNKSLKRIESKIEELKQLIIKEKMTDNKEDMHKLYVKKTIFIISVLSILVMLIFTYSISYKTYKKDNNSFKIVENEKLKYQINMLKDNLQIKETNIDNLETRLTDLINLDYKKLSFISINNTNDSDIFDVTISFINGTVFSINFTKINLHNYPYTYTVEMNSLSSIGDKWADYYISKWIGEGCNSYFIEKITEPESAVITVNNSIIKTDKVVGIYITLDNNKKELILVNNTDYINNIKPQIENFYNELRYDINDLYLILPYSLAYFDHTIEKVYEVSEIEYKMEKKDFFMFSINSILNIFNSKIYSNTDTMQNIIRIESFISLLSKFFIAAYFEIIVWEGVKRKRILWKRKFKKPNL